MYQMAQHFTLRLILSFTVCVSLLLLPGVSLLSEASQGQSQGRGARPRHKKPEFTLPDLEDVKNESHVEREAPPPLPSTVRSHKNPEKPWNGRRVGDPETPPRPAVDQPAERQIRRAHARRRAAPPPLSEEQFVQNFFSLAVLRSATADETLFWDNQLRVAYNQGQTSLKLAAVELAKTLFESAAYAARNRDAHGYVYDLYKTFLMREPDASGWAYWESQVAPNGRENVRRAFEEAPEFATLLSTVAVSGAVGSNPASLITARVEPRNQPGNGMLARDVNWSVSLLSLPGRNGLDLGLALSYSSLVWTPSGPYFHFDEDNGFPSPGFRLGFPTVQRKVFDAQTARNSFLLLTPTGRRVELRQVGTSNVYEAGDSSYLQLLDNSPTLLVRSTDGTQLSFVEINNEFSCTQVKDRNGNYLTINNNALGRITSITDTLGRAINFNYDSNANLISITQSWNGQPSHQWVSFGWSTRNMQYSFAADRVIGTAAGATLPVVTQVSLNDTSYFTFDYTNALQVSSIKNYFGGVERNANSFTYETPSGDVPRLLSSSVSAQNWTGLNGTPVQVTTQYSVAGDGACVLTAPDGIVYKEYYGTGWQKGLTTLSEIWSGGVKQKWTTTTWTQDNTTVSYETNPRVTETNIYDDGGNRRRTTIDYGQYAVWGLPYWVTEYAADGVTEIRRTFTDYNLSQPYLDRRIIGLVSAVHLTNVSSYQGKITYEYDDPARLSTLPAAATQHDTAYNTSFTARGNLTSVSRWDFTDINNTSKALTSYTNYFVTGTPASATDPSTHTSTISYTDAFSDGVNRPNAFAYPTTLTDADGYSSTVQYNFDFGATTRTQSPAPANQSQGTIRTMAYNSLGQLERVTTLNNGAYKRFWYGPNYVASYATVNNVADEAYAVQVVDGMGRVIGATTNHPGSYGGYSLVSLIYDPMGRLWLQSNPTEINSAWQVTGDDAAGIYYTQQTYDWKGRPLVTTNQDGTTKTAAYSGCGCAGGEVVTLTDEGTIDGGVARRRQQKIYSDVFSRTVKTEILNWQGGSVYSTTVNTYNVRDQITQVRQYAGAEGSGTYQDTTMTYDGYGRLRTKHLPEQQVDSNNTASTDHTTWDYNADGTVQKITDARGSVANFTYNSRHLVMGVSYTLLSGVPSSGPSAVSPRLPESFNYDAAGNRSSMTDSTGNVTYNYDQLSRMVSESRSFSGLSGTYMLSYSYNLANQLSSLATSIPYSSQQVGYLYDASGQLNTVTATGFNTWTYNWQTGQTTYYPLATFASNMSHRAWGATKHVDYGNGAQMNAQYNSRLQILSSELSNVQNNNSTTLLKTYDYYPDGRIHYAYDPAANVFDRSFAYDQVGRLTTAFTGSQARGGTANDGPYRQTYAHNAFGNLTQRTHYLWNHLMPADGASYTNNRRPDYQYDASGQPTWDWNEHTFDVAGRQSTSTVVDISAFATIDITQTYDGDGRSIYRQEHRVMEQEGEAPHEEWLSSYFLRSSVLGGETIVELNGAGLKEKIRVIAAGGLMAEEDNNLIVGGVRWCEPDGVTGSWMEISAPPNLIATRREMDPMGADVSENPWALSQNPNYLDLKDNGERAFFDGDDPFNPGSGCSLDGLAFSCSQLDRMIQAGAVQTYQPNVWRKDRNGLPSHPHDTVIDYGLGIYVTYLYSVSNAELGGSRNLIGIPPDNDPQEIQGDNNGKDCGVVATFKPGTTYPGTTYPNGPSTINYNGGSNFGLGFSISGWVDEGGIGTIGVNEKTGKKVTNPMNPNGRWSLEQWTHSWIGENGKVIVEKKTFPDLPTNETGLKAYDNTFGFYDHPGGPPPSTGLARFENHLIKVYRGKKVCEVKFHFIQRGNTMHWGAGFL